VETGIAELHEMKRKFTANSPGSLGNCGLDQSIDLGILTSNHKKGYPATYAMTPPRFYIIRLADWIFFAAPNLLYERYTQPHRHGLPKWTTPQ
jgi:hypothetical protein